jgi:hypothetical protein
MGYAEAAFFLGHDLGRYFDRHSASLRVRHLTGLLYTMSKDELMNVPHASCVGCWPQRRNLDFTGRAKLKKY